VFSTGTETGRAVADTLPQIDLPLYFPFFDWWLAVGRLYEQIRPTAVIVMETEIWPNFLRAARSRGIPVLVANGRISDRSYGRYLKFRWFFRQILPLVDTFCMQSVADAERIVAIGAPSARVQVGNNLKYDLTVQRLDATARQWQRRNWFLSPDSQVLVAGSTHAGEDELIVAAYQSLRQELPAMRLVLVPRHPERAGEVAALLMRERLQPVLSSGLNANMGELTAVDVLLVDQVGKLMDLYALADVVFVGGSLVPHGGHNILEPAAWGVPILHGPHMHNFREIAELFAGQHAARVVIDRASLTSTVRELLQTPVMASELGDAGARVVAENGGATERHLAALENLLETRGQVTGDREDR
jgi:3-deoxy-D-manno-octulosonic-acid transferase